jgi:HlyD family secretion protein
MNKTDLSKIRLSSQEKRLTKGGKRLIIGLAAICALAIVAVAAWFLMRGYREPEAASHSISPVNAERRTPDTPAQRMPPTRNVTAGGYIEALRTAVLSPGRTGVIRSIHVRLGQRVKKGQLMVQLNSKTEAAEAEVAAANLSEARWRLELIREGARPEEIESASAEVRAAEADLEIERRNLMRAESLAEKGLIPPADLEQARFRERSIAERLEVLRSREKLLRRGSRQSEIQAVQAEMGQAAAAFERAKADLDLSYLRAPFDGVVIRVDLEIGETVSLFSGLSREGGIVLADTSQLLVRVDVPESRIGKIELGDRAGVVVDALSGQTLEALVVEIAPVADRQSNTVEVAVQIVEPPEVLRPDMSARVTIIDGTGAKDE